MHGKEDQQPLRFAHKTVLANDAVEVAQLQIEFVDTAVRLCAEESARLGQIMMSAAMRDLEAQNERSHNDP